MNRASKGDLQARRVSRFVHCTAALDSDSACLGLPKNFLSNSTEFSVAWKTPLLWLRDPQAAWTFLSSLFFHLCCESDAVAERRFVTPGMLGGLVGEIAPVVEKRRNTICKGCTARDVCSVFKGLVVPWQKNKSQKALDGVFENAVSADIRR